VAEMPLSYPTNCHGLNEFRHALFSREMAAGGSTDISNSFSALRFFVIIVSSSA